ncbi:hypothetical protein Pelo_2161 [Pelomyxa schiedti]|nr:hypothetical protein Pelo_2161 [Pelomyxa schiedti]
MASTVNLLGCASLLVLGVTFYILSCIVPDKSAWPLIPLAELLLAIPPTCVAIKGVSRKVDDWAIFISSTFITIAIGSIAFLLQFDKMQWEAVLWICGGVLVQFIAFAVYMYFNKQRDDWLSTD